MSPEEQLGLLADRAGRVLDLCQARGAQRAAVSGSWGAGSRISYEKNDFNLAASSEGFGFGVTVHKDARMGSASVNSLDPADLERAVDLALGMARHSVPDEFLAMAGPEPWQPLEGTYDTRAASLGMGGLRDLAGVLVDTARRDGRVSLDSAQVESAAGVRLLLNSLGVRAHEAASSVSWSAMGMAIQGDDITSFDYLGDFSWGLEGCAGRVEATAAELAGRLLACLGPVKGESYKGPVLLPPAVVEEMLVDPLVYHMMGANIMDGKSRLGDMLDKPVAGASLTFHDRPRDLRLRGCAAFSGEGVPTREMVLVERGVLRRHLDSVYSARRRGTRPTGNGSGPHGLDVEAGPHALAGLRASREGLLEVGRYSGNIDPLSGDFSGVVKGGFLHGRSGPRPVREVMVSGNVFDLLQRGPLFSRERRDDGGSYFIPWALVDGVSVTAS